MKELYNVVDQKPEAVDTPTAMKGILSGTLAPKKDEMYAVYDENGEPARIPGSSLQQALNSGYVLMAPEEETDLINQKKYGEGLVNELQATVESAASSATFGLSDVALQAIGVEQEALRERRERNPIASAIGNIGGIVVPTILSGGANILAKGASTGVKAVFKAGTMAEKAAVDIIENTVQNQLAKETVGKIVGGAVEGAAFGAGQLASKVALGQEEINAESLVSHVGLGAILDGGLSGALKIAGTGLAKAIDTDYFKNTVNNALDADEVPLDFELIKEFGGKPQAKQVMREYADHLGVVLTEGQKADNVVTKKLAGLVNESGTFVGQAEAIKKSKQYDVFQNNLKKIFQDPQQASDMDLGVAIKENARNLVEELKTTTSAGYDRIRAVSQYIPVDIKLKNVAVNKIRNSLKQSFKGSKLPDEIESEVISLLDQQTTVAELQEFKKFVSSKMRAIEKSEGFSPKFVAYDKAQDEIVNLIEQSSLIDGQKVINQLKATGEFREELAADILDFAESYRAINQEYAGSKLAIQKLGNVLGIKLGKNTGMSGFIAKLNDADPNKMVSSVMRANPQDMIFLKESMPEVWDSVRNSYLNRVLKAEIGPNNETQFNLRMVDDLLKKDKALLDTLFDLEQLKTLKAIRYLKHTFPKSLNPSGTNIREEFSKYLSPMFYAYVARDLGIMAILKGANAGKKAMPNAAETINKALQKDAREIGQSLKGYVDKISTTGIRSAITSSYIMQQDSKRTEMQRYESAVKQLEKFEENPVAPELINNNLKPIYDVDQHLGNKVASKTMLALNKIKEIMPKNPNTSILKFKGREWKPSDFQVEKANRYLRAIDNPKLVFKDLENGHVTREGVEILRDVYPELYTTAKTYLLDNIDRIQQGAKYEDQIQLSLFFEMPLTDYLKPDMVAYLQQNPTQGMQQSIQQSVQQNTQIKRPMKDLSASLETRGTRAAKGLRG